VSVRYWLSRWMAQWRGDSSYTVDGREYLAPGWTMSYPECEECGHTVRWLAAENRWTPCACDQKRERREASDRARAAFVS
jgi:hypothetical protein